MVNHFALSQEYIPSKNLLQGLKAYQEKNFKTAVSYFERCSIFTDLLKDYIYFWWAHALKELGEEEKAGRFYEKVSKGAAIRKRAVEELILLSGKGGNWPGGLRLAKERLSLERDKRFKPYWEREVLEYGYLLNDASAALENFKRLIREFPETPQALASLERYKNFYFFSGDEISRARVYLRHGRFKNVLEILKDKTDRESLALRAEAFCGLKDYTQAVAILEGLTKEKDKGESRLRLGEVYLTGLAEEKGIQLLEKLIEENEGSRFGCLALWDLLNYWKKREDMEKAKIYSRRLRENYRLFSLTDKVIWWEGWMSWSKKDYDEAARVWEAFDGLNRSSREKMSSLYLRRWIKQASNVAEAGKFKEDLLSLYPDTYYGLKAFEENPSSSFFTLELPIKFGPLPGEEEFKRARALSKMGQKEEVIFELEALKGKRYNDLNLRYNLSRFYGEAGRFNEAMAEAGSLVDFFREKKNWPGFIRLKGRELLEINFPRFYQEEVSKSAREFKLDENLLYALIREESRFNEKDVSSSGAIGLMQLLPSTANWIMEKNKLPNPSGQDLFIPELNIRLGAWYFRYLLDKFNADLLLAVAAYNGGPGLIERWIKDGGIDQREIAIEMLPKEETKFYCQKVLFSYALYQKIYGNGGIY